MMRAEDDEDSAATMFLKIREVVRVSDVEVVVADAEMIMMRNTVIIVIIRDHDEDIDCEERWWWQRNKKIMRAGKRLWGRRWW